MRNFSFCWACIYFSPFYTKSLCFITNKSNRLIFFEKAYLLCTEFSMPRFCFIYKNYFSVFYNNIVKNDFWPIWESCSNLFTNSCFFTEIFLLSVIFIFIFKITNCDLKRIVVILRTKVVLLAYKPLLHKPFLWKERKINSIIAIIVLLVIASLVVPYLLLYHSTSPHTEWSISCWANLLSAHTSVVR